MSIKKTTLNFKYLFSIFLAIFFMILISPPKSFAQTAPNFTSCANIGATCQNTAWKDCYQPYTVDGTNGYYWGMQYNEGQCYIGANPVPNTTCYTQSQSCCAPGQNGCPNYNTCDCATGTTTASGEKLTNTGSCYTNNSCTGGPYEGTNCHYCQDVPLYICDGSNYSCVVSSTGDCSDPRSAKIAQSPCTTSYSNCTLYCKAPAPTITPTPIQAPTDTPAPLSYTCTNSGGDPCSCTGAGCRDNGGVDDFRCCSRNYVCNSATGVASCATVYNPNGTNVCSAGQTQSCALTQCVAGITPCTSDSQCTSASGQGVCDTSKGVCSSCQPGPPPPTYGLDCSRFTATAKQPDGTTATVGGVHVGSANIPTLNTMPGEIVRFANNSIVNDSGGVSYETDLSGNGKICHETGLWSDPDTNFFKWCSNGVEHEDQGTLYKWDVDFPTTVHQQAIDSRQREMVYNPGNYQFISAKLHNGYLIDPTYTDTQCVINVNASLPAPVHCPGAINLGGVLNGNPKAIVFNNKLFIFARGRQGIYYKSATSSGGVLTWTTPNPGGWQVAGATDIVDGISNIMSDPVPAIINGRLYLLARGTDITNPEPHMWVYYTYTDDGINFSKWAITQKTRIQDDNFGPLELSVQGSTLYVSAYQGWNNNTNHQSTTSGAGSAPSWTGFTVGDAGGSGVPLNGYGTNTVTFDSVNYTINWINDKSIDVCGGNVPTDTPIPTPTTAPPTFTISGTVWDDSNKDGVLDASETGRFGGLPIIVDSTQVTTTDASGNYTITNIPAGTYGISVAGPFPAGYSPVWPKVLSYSVNFGLAPSCSFADIPGKTTHVPPQSTATDIACDAGNNIIRANFGLSNAQPWIQGVGLNLRFDRGYDYNVPPSSTVNPSCQPYVSVPIP